MKVKVKPSKIPCEICIAYDETMEEIYDNYESKRDCRNCKFFRRKMLPELTAEEIKDLYK